MRSHSIEHFIEHIIEPTKLLMTWQDNQERTRYVVAELNRVDDKIKLQYLVDSNDFLKARSCGFEYYPAFQNINETYESGVLDSLMRRLPPKSRADYAQYLEGFRIQPNTNLSDFALLGYTGARLPSDGFAIVNPFYEINTSFEFLLEAAGYRYISNLKIDYDDRVSFRKEFDNNRNEEVIKIFVGDQHIGYVTRALIPYMKAWIVSGRIVDAWVEKKNGNPEQPVVYIYVEISAK